MIPWARRLLPSPSSHPSAKPNCAATTGTLHLWLGGLHQEAAEKRSTGRDLQDHLIRTIIQVRKRKSREDKVTQLTHGRQVSQLLEQSNTVISNPDGH